MKSPAKIGSWKREDFHSFLRLPDEADEAKVPQQTLYGLSSLLSPSPIDEARTDGVDLELLAARLKAVHAHPIIIQLNKQESFKALLATFKVVAAKVKPPLRASRPDSILAFLHWVVLCIGGASASGRAESGFGPTSENRDKARLHIANLILLADKGVFIEVPYQFQLKPFLKALDDSIASIKRKKRVKGSPRSEWVFRFAESLERLGIDCPKLILEFAALVGEFIDPRTARRYRDQAKAEQQRAAKEWNVTEAQGALTPIIAEALLRKAVR